MRNNEIHDLFSAKKAINELISYEDITLNASQKETLLRINSKIDLLELELRKIAKNNGLDLHSMSNHAREEALAKNLADAHSIVIKTTTEILQDLPKRTTKEISSSDTCVYFLNEKPSDDEQKAYATSGSYCLIKNDSGYYLGYPDMNHQYQQQPLDVNSLLAKMLNHSQHISFYKKTSINFTIVLRITREVKKLGGKLPNLIEGLLNYVSLCVQLVNSFSIDKSKNISTVENGSFRFPGHRIALDLAVLIEIPLWHQRSGLSPLNAQKWYDTRRNSLVEFGGVAGGMCHGFSMSDAQRIMEGIPQGLFYLPSEDIIKTQLTQKKSGDFTSLATGYLDTQKLLNQIITILDQDPTGIYILQLREEAYGGHELLFRKLPNNTGYEYSENACGIFYFKTAQEMISLVALQFELSYRHSNFFITGAKIQKFGEQPKDQSALTVLIEKLQSSTIASPKEKAVSEKKVTAEIIRHCHQLCEFASKKLPLKIGSKKITEDDVRLFENMVSSFKTSLSASALYLSPKSLDILFLEIEKEMLGGNRNILFMEYKTGETIIIFDELRKKEVLLNLKQACFKACFSKEEATEKSSGRKSTKADEAQRLNIGFFSSEKPSEAEFVTYFKMAVLSASRKYLAYKKLLSMDCIFKEVTSRLTRELANIQDDRPNTFFEIMQALKNYFNPQWPTISPNFGKNTYADFLLQALAGYQWSRTDLFKEISSRSHCDINAPQRMHVTTESERAALFNFFKLYSSSMTPKTFAR